MLLPLNAIQPDIVLQNAIDAISVGSLFALFALGIALIFGIMGLINFAHGELILASALTLVLLDTFPILLTAALAAGVAIALALAMDRVAFRPIRSAPPATLLITSFAVSFTLQNLVILIFGARPRTTNVATPLTQVFEIGGVIVPKINVLTVVLTAVLLVATQLFLTRTRVGTQMRAAAEDFRMARILGLKANRIIAIAFAISGLLAAAAAVLLVAQTGTVTPTMGVTAVIFGFIATVVGGLGSLPGAVLGGYVVGALVVTLQASLSTELRPYRDAFAFIVIFGFLIVRPRGLLPPRATQVRV
jgi:branched-chain amino acid transport system permease protein